MERPVPCNIQAEYNTLGALLLDRDAIILVASKLHPEDFSLLKHAHIYAAILDCYERNIPPDVVTVSEVLRKRNQLDDVGGYSYLTELSAEVPTAYHIEFYAEPVISTARRRRQIEAGGRITALAYDERISDEDALSSAQQVLDTVHRSADDDGATFADVASRVRDRWKSDEPPGVPTGLRDFDGFSGGLGRQSLIYLAARPSTGKTSLALQILNNLATAGGHAAIFSFEQGDEELLQRLVAAHLAYDTQDIFLKAWSATQRDSDGQTALAHFSQFRGRFYTEPHLSVNDIRARALKQAHHDGPLDLIVVDYVQLIQMPKADTTTEALAIVSRTLKLLARELNCPVLALSQLNRAVEGRTGHIPMLSDLRSSGAQEQDADTILFIHRPVMYDKDANPYQAQIYIAKQRNGRVGMIQVRFDAPTGRWDDFERWRDL